MTDYAEEQRNEIEALESIYPDEIEILQESPHHVFTVKVASQDPDTYVESIEGVPDKVGCLVQFTYTEKYPDEAPVMELTSSEDLQDDQLTVIMDYLKEQAEENVGMVMVFTLISALQEKLTVMVEEMKKDAEERKIRRQREEEEAAQKRFEGTIVTIESFMAWKSKFESERQDNRQREKEKDALAKKPTGKELFMKDASMNDSDITFLQEEGENVEVDESLFEDMEDLELEDEDEEEDPDYVP